jgi:branched-chain amino acid transport system substrate-binding protein
MSKIRLLTKLASVGLIILMISLIFGCSGATTTAPATTNAIQQKVLKIGTINWLGWPNGITDYNIYKVLIAAINEKGGLAVGNDKYTLELISYDSQNSQETAVAAANRLIYQDGVKFILSDGNYTSGYTNITDPQKVIVIAATPDPGLLNPKYNYAFNAATINSSPVVVLGWFAKNFPDKHNYVTAFIEDQSGLIISKIFGQMFAAFNIQNKPIFYPAGQTDLSTVATQAVQMKPDVFIWVGAETNIVKSVRQAGYTGQLFSINTKSFTDLTRAATPKDLEGLIIGALPTEFTPELTKGATDFKATYTSKMGKWDDPSLDGTLLFNCLVSGMQKAGSIDTEKVASVISSGMQFETPLGPARMFARPDLGNTRTVDVACTTYIKQVVNGTPKLISTISVDEGVPYCQNLFKAKK